MITDSLSSTALWMRIQAAVAEDGIRPILLWGLAAAAAILLVDYARMLYLYMRMVWLYHVLIYIFFCEALN